MFLCVHVRVCVCACSCSYLLAQFFKYCGLQEDFSTCFYLECLHVWMLLVRLRREGSKTTDLRQDLFDRFWEDITKQVAITMHTKDPRHYHRPQSPPPSSITTTKTLFTIVLLHPHHLLSTL